MGPYRPLYTYDEPEDEAPDGDDRFLGWAMIVLALVRVIPAFYDREPFGSEATIALVMLASGAAIVARVWRRRGA